MEGEIRGRGAPIRAIKISYGGNRLRLEGPAPILQRMAGHFAGLQKRNHTMAWNTPKIVEIAVGMEINCYACATL